MRDISMFPELEGEDHVPGKNFWGFTTVLFSWDIVVNQSRVRIETPTLLHPLSRSPAPSPALVY